jgi:hypothetical protein
LTLSDGSPEINGEFAIAATVTMTAAFSIDAATDPENDGLWPVGAFMVLVAFGQTLCLAAMCGVRAQRLRFKLSRSELLIRLRRRADAQAREFGYCN